MDITYLDVLFYASLTAVATGLGALPFLFFRDIADEWLGYGNAAASGLMLAASFSLIFEGQDIGTWRTLGGVLAGLVFIAVLRHFLENGEHHEGKVFTKMASADALKALMIVGVMTVHSSAEGIGVGVSFGGGIELGALITIAIAVHNIPEGLAISLVLVPRGEPVWKAALWSIFSSLPQPLLALPAFWFVEVFRPFLPVGLGFAAGAMIWMVFSELIPEALEEASPQTVAVITTVAIAAMMAFQFTIGM